MGCPDRVGGEEEFPCGKQIHRSSMERGNCTGMVQIFVKLLDGKTANLRFTGKSTAGGAIKRRIFEITKIPIQSQRLISGGRQIGENDAIWNRESTAHLVLRLPGGKGGFGSLLRGAASKSGQKNSNNFDACRDMSGRRLRHVNAEKRLEEWKAEEEERRLEKIAEQFIKKSQRKGKKCVDDGEVDKYVKKYREESAKCAAEVEDAVREACLQSGRKRKKGEVGVKMSKRFNVWLGKRRLGDSDSESEEEEEEENSNDDERSMVINDKNSPISSTEDGGGSSDSVTGGKQEADDDAAATAAAAAATATLSPNGDAPCDDDNKNRPEVGSELVPEAINFDDFNSPSELEVVGMERLKMELQGRGLKCGGTLAERAARLFLLKSIPLSLLPKKLFSKK